MRLTDRDRAILSLVARFRFLTTSLILSLIPGSRQNITRRLQALFHAGLLDRPRSQLPLRYSGELSEFVYCLTRKTSAGRGYKAVTSLFLAHVLMVSEVLIRIESGARAQGATFVAESEILAATNEEPSARRLQWRLTLKADSAKEHVGVIPDGAFAIEIPTPNGGTRRFNFLVEVDRGTMPIDRKGLRSSSIRRKLLAYSRTARSKILNEKFGLRGFSVLFVTMSMERAARMAELCSRVVGTSSRHFIFVTMDDFRSSPLASVDLPDQSFPSNSMSRESASTTS